MKKFLLLIASLLLLVAILPAQIKNSKTKKKAAVNDKAVFSKNNLPKKTSDFHIKITTDSGIIIIKLYDSTPIHRDNFVKLVESHFYDSLLFHRVIPNFMVQGGDPKSRNAAPGKRLGDDTMKVISAEIKPYYFHKRGVLAAAREGDDVNPKRSSSGCQFYIVTGQKFTDDQLSQLELKLNRFFTPEQREVYKTIGGAPWLDDKYTIFGEVESGMEVVDKIAGAKKDSNNRPLVDIRMKMELLK